MGVDFYTCQNESCGRTYPDCGRYYTCSSCESSFCSDTCGGKQYIEDENGNRKETDWGEASNCILCRYESISSGEMIGFLLAKLGVTYDQAFDMFREKNRKK